MTAPGKDEETTDSTPAATPTKGAPAVLAVVGYLHHDPILGGPDRPALGVVMRVDGGAVHVRPLQAYDVPVDADRVRTLTAADLGLADA